MKFLVFLAMVVDMISLYVHKKENTRKLKLDMMRRVDKAFQEFADDVASGDEDEVSRKISELLSTL